MVANRRHISENNKPMSIMRNHAVTDHSDKWHVDFWGKIGKFTKIIGKIHGSRKKKRGQSRITGKIKDFNSRFTKKIKLNSRITEKIRGGQFTVHEENKTQFTVHSKNKSPITVHGNTSLRPSMDVNWWIMLGQNDHYVGTNLFFLDRVSMMAFIDQGMNLIWTMMLYSRADINNVWSVEKYLCTPCHHSVCKPLHAVELFDSTGMTLSEPLRPNSNGSELGESLAVVVLLWFCACEGVHNTDTFRLSAWALSPFMLESVWRRWWCLGGCSGGPCLTRFEILLWGNLWSQYGMMILFHVLICRQTW